MKHSNDRILTTHVGSLTRPPQLLAGGARDGTPEARAQRLALAVAGIVARQKQIGLDVINDGEFGKSGWSVYALERISGFEVQRDRLQPLHWLGSDRQRFADFFAAEMPEALAGVPCDVCVAPIRYCGTDALRTSLTALRDAADAVDHEDLFMTAVAPASTAYNGANEYYETDRDYVFAIADALREEYAAIHEAGFLVQIDDAVLANMYDTLTAKNPSQYREWAQLRVDALNHALRGIPAERVRYHVCFGSWHVPHVADAPLEAIVGFITQVNAQAYLIEAANVRHEHEWRVWERVKLADGKILVPGVVTHHTTVVEHPRLVADRIVRFANLVGRENVIAGTDCGFAQTDTIQRVHPSIMWAKLEALVAGARIASEELWA